MTSFSLLIDYLALKLTSEKSIKVVKDYKYLISTQNLPETSFDLFCTNQKFEFLPNYIAVLEKQLQLQIINNSQGLRYN